MAILQLSRITHRKGLSENLPQLAGAEFGWVLDDRQLFIGNGTIEDGAPVIGNTEILTEYSDILALASGYTYEGAEAGYVVVTGPSSTDITRTLQAKFDDFASVKDFGAVGDGIVDDTDAINRALYELFCAPGLNNSSTNDAARRALFFPAGVYRVTGTIKVPPHAKLYGDGLTSSVIKYDTGPTTDAVVETADSDQLTGINMTTGATGQLPVGIEMSSMSIESTIDNTLLKLDSVTNSGFYYLGLTGPNTEATTATANTSAVEIATNAGVTHDVTLSKLATYGTTYGLRAEGDVKGVVLENSGLEYHYKGVYVTNAFILATAMTPGVRYKIIDVGNTDFVTEQAGSAEPPEFNREGATFTADAVGTGTGRVISMDDPGATGIVISRNIFDNVAQEGIHFENTLFNSSGYNVFYNVANGLGATAVAPVITFETDQCASIGDLFEREDESVHPRISLEGNGGIYIDGTHSMHLGSYERQVGIEATLPNNTTVAETLFGVEETVANSYRVDYNITRGTNSKMGRLYVSYDGTTLNYNDEYTQSSDPQVVLSVIAGTGTGTDVQFTTVAGSDATMRYSIVRLD